MKLARLYSNHDSTFPPITFRDGLNVVLGEIRLIEDRDKDTHNLGKTTLGRLIDFCLLAERNKKTFLFSHMDLFEPFVFFLEMELSDGLFLTIRRPVAEASKISLLVHHDIDIDARELSDAEWTHQRLPFERAKLLVDDLLSLSALGSWRYRKVLPYLIRLQGDFSNVFRPPKFQGRDRDWKPFLLHILGFDETAFIERYQLEDAKQTLTAQQHELVTLLDKTGDKLGSLDALIDIREREIEQHQQQLDQFQFDPSDEVLAKRVAGELDERIVELNNRRYALNRDIAKIEQSLARERLLFDEESVRTLFEETGILFEGQIARDYNQLLAFNRAISTERRGYLRRDLKEARDHLVSVSQELAELDRTRSDCLKQLDAERAFEKYKAASSNLLRSRTELEELKVERERVIRLQGIDADLVANTTKMSQNEAAMRSELTRNGAPGATSLLRDIRREFDEIVHSVLDRHGLLTVNLNGEGHAEFFAGILDHAGRTTNAAQGETYQSLLCTAFDLALLAAHGGKGFPTFVYHDNAFGSLDLRKRECLLTVMRSYADRGIQQIVTAIDSDMPRGSFTEDEIILTLHDVGREGRLFKFAEW